MPVPRRTATIDTPATETGLAIIASCDEIVVAAIGRSGRIPLFIDTSYMIGKSV